MVGLYQKDRQSMHSCMLGQCGKLITILVVSIAASWLHQVHTAPLFTAEPMIVSQQLTGGVCVDNLGAVRGDLEEWTSETGSCDKVVCHVEPSGNYTITHSCRPIEPYENPDTDNCQWESDTLQTYPDCCPQLVCGVSLDLTTVDPTLCYDLASSFACGVWYNLTSGCTDTTTDTYNISQIYCESTCGIC